MTEQSHVSTEAETDESSFPPLECIVTSSRGGGKVIISRNGWHRLKTEAVAVSSSPSLWVFQSHFETRKKQGPGDTRGQRPARCVRTGRRHQYSLFPTT